MWVRSQLKSLDLYSTLLLVVVEAVHAAWKLGEAKAYMSPLTQEGQEVKFVMLSPP